MKKVLSSTSVKYLYMTVSIVSLVAYSFVAFAAAPSGGYTPGAVLDPTCAPGSTSPTPCIVNISASTGLSYAGPVTSGHNNEVLYVDGSGNLASDANFTRASATGVTNIQATLGPDTAAYQLSDNLFGFGIHGALQSYGSGSNLNVVLTGDFSGVGGADNTTLVGYTDFGPTSSNASYGFDSGSGLGTITNQVHDGGGAVNTTLTTAGGFVVNGKDTSGSSRSFLVKDGNGNKIFAVFNDGTVKINDTYTLPTSDGTNGYVLTTDGSGAVTWQAGGGSPLPSQTGNNGKYLTTNGTIASWATLPSLGSGFTIDGASNMYAAQGTGSGASLTTGISNFFVGIQAGNLTSSGNYNTFVGIRAGSLNDTGGQNTFVGTTAGANSTGNNNTFVGMNSGMGLTTGNQNAYFGDSTGSSVTSGSGNTFLGSGAGSAVSAVAMSSSTFVGGGAGATADGAAGSTFVGYKSGSGALTAKSSIFIGFDAGLNDTVDNSVSGTSILIGGDSSTGDCGGGIGCSDSIALGTGATNTASHQFIIGSASSPINQIVMVAAGGTTCATDINGTSCSSDRRLKTNIVDLDDTTLDTLLKVKTVTFNWNNETDHSTHLGFIAQDMQQYFPELVSTGATGYLSVNYAGITPVLTKAIQELDLKMVNIETFAADSVDSKTFVQNLIAWLANATNGIGDLFAKTLHSNDSHTKELCVGDADGETCITKSQLDHLLQLQSVGMSGGGGSTVTTVSGDGSGTPPVDPAPVSNPNPNPSPSADPVPVPSNDPVVTPDPVPAPNPAPAVDPAPVPVPVPAPDPVPVTDAGGGN